MTSSTPSEYQWKKIGDFNLPRMPGLKLSPVSVEEETQEGPSEDHQLGYDAGYAVGIAQAQADSQQIIVELKALLEETHRLKQRCISEGLQDATVALHTLFKVLFQYELRTSAGLLMALIEELKGLMQAESLPQLFLSSVDFEAVRAALPTDLQTQVLADASLSQGVIRATAGKSMLELDVVANLEQVLANGIAQVDDSSFLPSSDAIAPEQIIEPTDSDPDV